MTPVTDDRAAVAIRPEDVKRLRERTGAGVMDCKRALEESGGDLEQAVERLRRQGLDVAAKKAGRAAREGLIGTYVHHGARLGAMVELNCETDFVARTDDFQALARDLAIQVAGLDPLFVSRDEVPAEVVAARRAELTSEAEREGRDPERLPAVVEGRLDKWYQQVCLLEQPYRDTDRRVQDLIVEKVALLGENIRVARFARMAVGESGDAAPETGGAG